jgi:Holliday junction resolvasome RuvABC ATP-dependent DNA helicase subunit
MEYNISEKEKIIKKYLEKYWIKATDKVISEICKKVDAVPREIHNLCIKIRDYVITETNDKNLDEKLWENFLKHSKIDDGWMTPIHKKYLQILKDADRPLGVKTIAVQLWIHEKAVEEDIEPILLKLGKIEKTAWWRILVE